MSSGGMEWAGGEGGEAGAMDPPLAGTGGANGGAAGSTGGAGTGGSSAGQSGGGGQGGVSGGGAGGAGTGGQGGAGTGGTTAGSGGVGGIVIVGGVGGTVFGGAAGVSANAGMAGAGALAGDLKECAERCSDNDDCLVFGADLGYVCNQSTRRCEGFADPCTDSTECIPDASLWLWACNNDADCFFFTDDVCVDIGGLGFCARMVPYGGCVDPTPDEVTLPRHSMSGTVEVCAQTDRQ
jgi:hypothetical protein